MIERLQNIQGFLREILTPRIQQGSTALDLTAGRGRDTLFLAQAVGPQGKVHAFDIQPLALAETHLLLEEHGVRDWVVLHEADHAQVRDYLSGPVHVAMFNLGYLPGSDHSVTTKAQSTLLALESVLTMLAHNGLLAITVYRGHPGGEEEAKALEHVLSSLPRKDFSVLEGKYTNQGDQTPYWILVQKSKGENG